MPGIDPISLALGALGGGGSTTNVSQTASNTTSLNLSSILNTGQNPNGPVSGGATSGAASGAGVPTPPAPSPLNFPFEGVNTLGAANNVAAGSGNALPAGNIAAGAVAIIVVAGVIHLLFGRKKKGG